MKSLYSYRWLVTPLLLVSALLLSAQSPVSDDMAQDSPALLQRARLVLADRLLRLRDSEGARALAGMVARDAKPLSPEALQASAWLQADASYRYQKGLPVEMPVWSGYPLTAAGAMCIGADGLRVPASAANGHCEALFVKGELSYRACGNTQFGSAGRTVQLIVSAQAKSCSELGFQGEPVTPAEVDEAVTLLGRAVPAGWGKRFVASK